MNENNSSETKLHVPFKMTNLVPYKDNVYIGLIQHPSENTIHSILFDTETWKCIYVSKPILFTVNYDTKNIPKTHENSMILKTIRQIPISIQKIANNKFLTTIHFEFEITDKSVETTTNVDFYEMIYELMIDNRW